MIGSQNKLFYLHHSINTLDNNPFVLTAISSNIQELKHSLLLYRILLSSCELSSGSQQTFYKAVTECAYCVATKVTTPSIASHPILPMHYKCGPEHTPMIAEKCNCI